MAIAFPDMFEESTTKIMKRPAGKMKPSCTSKKQKTNEGTTKAKANGDVEEHAEASMGEAPAEEEGEKEKVEVEEKQEGAEQKGKPEAAHGLDQDQPLWKRQAVAEIKEVPFAKLSDV